jgi:hypothetical protein
VKKDPTGRGLPRTLRPGISSLVSCLNLRFLINTKHDGAPGRDDSATSLWGDTVKAHPSQLQNGRSAMAAWTAPQSSIRPATVKSMASMVKE